jgi:hypothetical protein
MSIFEATATVASGLQFAWRKELRLDQRRNDLKKSTLFHFGMKSADPIYYSRADGAALAGLPSVQLSGSARSCVSEPRASRLLYYYASVGYCTISRLLCTSTSSRLT